MEDLKKMQGELEKKVDEIINRWKEEKERLSQEKKFLEQKMGLDRKSFSWRKFFYKKAFLVFFCAGIAFFLIAFVMVFAFNDFPSMSSPSGYFLFLSFLSMLGAVFMEAPIGKKGALAKIQNKLKAFEGAKREIDGIQEDFRGLVKYLQEFEAGKVACRQKRSEQTEIQGKLFGFVVSQSEESLVEINDENRHEHGEELKGRMSRIKNSIRIVNKFF